jgi:hypothetical protein
MSAEYFVSDFNFILSSPKLTGIENENSELRTQNYKQQSKIN